jgi:signal transduction histidine kinase
MAHRRHIFSAAAIVFCLLFCACRPALATGPKRVLLLYNSVGYQELVAQFVRTELQQRSPELLEIYSAPFVAASAADEGVTTRYADYLGALLLGQSLDLVVTVGSPATSFFQHYGRQFSPSAPMLAILEQSRVPSQLESNETVVTGSLDLVGAIENILRLLPNTTNISVVIGNSPLEQYWLEKERVAFHPFAGQVSFAWSNDLSFEDILKHAATLSSGSAILFNSLFRDALGVAYEDDAVVSKLHDVAKAPIFSFDDSAFGQGIVGGHGPSTQDVSRDYASVALRILHGDVLGGVIVSGISAGQPKFDWREMQRWGIDENRLPPGSTIYYRDPTGWQRYRWQIMTIAAALLVQTLLILGLFYERHRRRHAEAVSRQHMSELTHMNRLAAAGELSASIAHEVSQPLTGIVARAGTARRWLAGEKPEIDRARAALDQIERAGLRASEIIQNVRAIFKKDSPDKAPVDINTIILSVVALGRHELQKHQIELRTDLDGRLPNVSANEVQLQQVILNLLMNAIEAMHSAQTRVLRIQSNLSESGALHVSVEDSGTGIKPPELERIFKPLFTTKGSGMGMGLSICRSIIETHGGRIWASPGIVTGSVFQFELPTGP